MGDTYKLRKQSGKEYRQFMTFDISSKYWNKTEFEKLKVGDRVFYIIINGKNQRSPIYIVREEPRKTTHHGLCCEVEMSPDKNQHGMTLKELKISVPEMSDDYLPIVVRDRTGIERSVVSFSRGIFGEIVLNV